jgi:hypothetical protein
MALSGVAYENVGSHWRLSVEWTGSQSISGNYTDITARMYWEATDQYGYVYSSASKDGSVYIDGWQSFSGVSAGLSGNQKKHLATKTFRVHHNDNGTGSVTIDGYFDAEVSLAGVGYVGRINITGKTFSLNTIPRKSTMTSSRNFTAGSNRTITINRASSSFNHEVEISVKNSSGAWDWVKRVDFSTGDTSESTSFSVAEHTEIFSILAQRSSADVRMVLQTFSGSTLIGENEYTGTVTAPAASTARITNPTGVSEASGQGDSTVYVDQTINLSISRANSDFTHTVRFLDSNNGALLKQFTGQNTSVSWNPTTTEQNNIYALMTDSIERDAEIEITTYYNGVKVRSITNCDINYRVRNAEPTFSSSQIDYLDVNATTVTLTGDSSKIIQNKSSLQAKVLSAATANKGASIVKYVISINGKTDQLTGVGVKTMGTLSASTDQTLTVKAIDSRGLETKVTKTVSMIPYSEPNIVANAQRQNSFGSNVTLKTSLEMSSILSKNAKTLLQYRYKERGASTYIRDWTNIGQSSASSTKFVGANISLTMEVTKEYTIEIKASDKLTSNLTMTIDIATGQPIFFVDADMRSVGFNDFPSSSNEFKVNGRIVFGSNMYASNTGEEGVGAGALFLNNSDITGINGLWFNDIANNKGEGLLFIKSTATAGSTNNADYNSLYVRDGWFYMDDEEFMAVRSTPGDTSGVSVTIGGDGLTIIGSGESVDYTYDNHGGNDGLENMYVTSDNDIYLLPGMNGGWSSRQTFQFTSGGDLNVPRQVNSGPNLRMNGFNTIENVNNTLYLYGNGGIHLSDTSSGGFLQIAKDSSSAYVESDTIFERTYPYSSNVYITSNGVLGRSTSASKYKKSIETVTDMELSERFLQLEPKSWIDKTQSYEQLLSQMGYGEFVDQTFADLPRHYGLIAEDLVAAGLSQFVLYGSDGQVEGIQYERVWILLFPIIKDLRERVIQLENQLAGSSTSFGGK